MNGLIRSLVLLTTLSALVSGCSKGVEPQPNTYSQLLTGTTKKTWRLASLQIIDEGRSSGVTPAASFLDPCEADDQFVFYANEERRFEFTDGTIKCSTSDPDLLLTASWGLNTGRSTIEMPLPTFFGPDILPFTLKRLTETSMTVELYLENLTSDNLNASYRFTFTSNNK